VDLVYGVIEPGGAAERHYHDQEFQAFLVIKGRATVSLGSEPPQECGPGHVIRIPPRVPHQVLSLGPDPLELVIVYAPRLSGPPIPA
jgi:quercetin dioxygenase-like cupin family protein